MARMVAWWQVGLWEIHGCMRARRSSKETNAHRARQYFHEVPVPCVFPCTSNYFRTFQRFLCAHNGIYCIIPKTRCYSAVLSLVSEFAVDTTTRVVDLFWGGLAYSRFLSPRNKVLLATRSPRGRSIAPAGATVNGQLANRSLRGSARGGRCLQGW